MFKKTVYITVDDFPSSLGLEKIEFLTKNNIPAVIYARGECLKNHLSMAVEAIQRGFLIGNHSYHHPSFSKLTIQECRLEIDQTEILIDQAYQQAGCKRPLKTVRFPFGHRAPQEIEDYLVVQNFKKAILPPYLENLDAETKSVSVPWSIDTMDYKVRLTSQPHLLIQHLDQCFRQEVREEIVLVHDFDHNQEAFYEIIKYFQGQYVEFKELAFHD